MGVFLGCCRDLGWKVTRESMRLILAAADMEPDVAPRLVSQCRRKDSKPFKELLTQKIT
jgi:hypothetical protein